MEAQHCNNPKHKELEHELVALMERYGFPTFFLTATDMKMPCPDVMLFGACKGEHEAHSLTRGIPNNMLEGFVLQSLYPMERVEEIIGPSMVKYPK